MNCEVRGIVAGELRRGGYDGLRNEEKGCGCSVNDELMPCDCSIRELGSCEPAFERICPCCGSTIYVTANRGQS